MMAVHNLLGLQEEFEDTKEVIRVRKSKTNRQRNGQQIEDTTKGVIRIHKSKNRQHNGQMIDDTKGIIKDTNRRRTDNTMAKSLKILKG